MKEYEPKEDTLLICRCGVVLDKDIVKNHERDENDCKVAFLRCPVCHNEEEVSYDA